MKKYWFFSLILFGVILFFPNSILADGGMMIWPPKVHLDQSAQNAIVAWNGTEEIIILSNDIKSDTVAIVLRMVPLPSNPSEVKEGSFESFEKLVKIINEKREEMWNEEPPEFEGKGGGAAAGVEITFHKKIGAHDVTVVKVNDLDYFLNWIKDFAIGKGLLIKEISPEFKEGVRNYLKRDIKYFVFDVIDTEEGEESIKPLIYQFESDFLYYPLKITAISEVGSSYARISVFLIVKEFVGKEIKYEFPVELTPEELEGVSGDIAELFELKAEVVKIDYRGKFTEFNKDFVLFPTGLWQKDLTQGDSGKEIKILQKILINEGVWDSEVGATGYFGPITQAALAKFQEEHKYQILEPLNLEKGTGYFGPKTREFLERITVKSEQELKKILEWPRNLYLGIRSNEVKALQEILIKERVWGRPDVGATGYFGPITERAVIKFQEKHAAEILEPLGLTKGTGFFGPSTRAYLEKIIEE